MKVTKKFLTGILKGEEFTIETNVQFQLGKTYSCCVTRTKYKITKIEGK